jgi:HK97 family phage major capsid protein/HK97 family phage prohead protease
MFEGRFLERISPGAFRKTINENRDKIRVLFQHGRDPQIGDKPLGPIGELREDDKGVYYEVPLLDTSYNRDLIPGLREGLYGASFRFSVLKEELVSEPKRSAYNPDGLPERTLTEVKLSEFGPVTFPAYSGATAGVRSATDWFREAIDLGRELEEERVPMPAGMSTMPGGVKACSMGGTPGYSGGAACHVHDGSETGMAAAMAKAQKDTKRDALPDDGAAEEHSTGEAATPRHSTPTEPPTSTPTQPSREEPEPKEGTTMDTIEELVARQEEIKTELKEIASENRAKVLSAEDQGRWDAFEEEFDNLEARINAESARQERLQRFADNDTNKVPGVTADTGTFVTARTGRDTTPEDPFDVAAYHGRARDQQHMMKLIGDGARRAIETFNYPHPNADKDTVNTHIEMVLRQDSPDKEIATRILSCGSELYHRAFWKNIVGQPMTNEETRALAVGSSTTGGAAVPIDLDPTLIPTSNGQLNPMRQISRVFTTTSYLWSGVTSTTPTATYRAEGALMSDNSPTLGAPQIQPERADVFIPFSWELGQDWGSLESNLAELIQDSKDALESTKFASGAGHASTEPQGILTGASTIIGSVASTAFSVGDLYRLEGQLPARHLANATWLATPATYGKVRQFDTSGGASLWVMLPQGNPAQLLGYPAYKSSTVGTAAVPTASAVWAVFGDFQKYAIVDRIGMSVRVIPDLFGTSTTALTVPTGQSGLVAFWRNSAGVLDSNAFRKGTIVTTGI